MTAPARASPIHSELPASPIHLADLDATRNLAESLAAAVGPGEVLAIDGQLGSGKTTLVRALIVALGGDGDQVSSPSYTLLHTYATTRWTVVHVDAWRLGGPGDLDALGFSEALGEGIAAVEWAERVLPALPGGRTWRIGLAHDQASGGRIATIVPPPSWFDRQQRSATEAGDVRTIAMSSRVESVPGPSNAESTDVGGVASSVQLLAEPSPIAQMTDPQPTPPAVHAVTRIDAVDGADPLVRRYLELHRPTCAWRTFSWPWLLLGVVFGGIGAAIGSHLAGPPLPLTAAHDPLVGFLHIHFGNLSGALLGLIGGAMVASSIGAFIHRSTAPAGQEPWYAAAVLAVVYLLFFDWLICLGVVAGAICVIYTVAILFRLLAVAMGGGRGFGQGSLAEPPGGWPRFTVLVPLYRERNVARNILVSLEKLDYPRSQLDVQFLLEADDPETLAALQTAGVPPWAAIVVVPPAQPKTKPRACNHGLERATGEFLVIFDAEDRPDPDQLKKAVLTFRQLDQRKGGDRVVCLQAHLAYHNHRQNLLTRWFAVEYNVWFGRYLAGLVRLGVPIPLGGTSNHFRTDALRALGGWDPFNVTEDCDLGVRLHIAGKRTAMLDSVTWEEANSHVGNWIRQRSRWLKGYAITHLVWSRRPVWLLWRLGPWAALGFFSSVFCVSVLAALNLILWLITGTYAGLLAWDFAHGISLYDLLVVDEYLDHQLLAERLSWPLVYSGHAENPVLSTLSMVFAAAAACLFMGNLAFVAVAVIWGRRVGQRGLIGASLLTPLYWWLIAIGAWKGLWQLLVKPHYWEKTVHGLDGTGKDAG
ncbi:hypothetical protein LBMAG53_30430 [Planctomycetota bacterium]|nr:hypothetical protein LBMAG53_30430 [Planctomycetota bacterium]